MKRRTKKEAGERKEGWFSTPSAPLSSFVHAFVSSCSWTRPFEKDQSKSAGSVTPAFGGVLASRAPGPVDPNRVEKERNWDSRRNPRMCRRGQGPVHRTWGISG